MQFVSQVNLPLQCPALPTATPFAGQVPSGKFLMNMAAFQLFVAVRNAAVFRLVFRILYHKEELECGHVHMEFPDGNPPTKRRRCRKCL